MQGKNKTFWYLAVGLFSSVSQILDCSNVFQVSFAVFVTKRKFRYWKTNLENIIVTEDLITI